MRKIICLLLVSCITVASSAQLNDVKQSELKGKVRSVKLQRTYRYKKTDVFTPWEKTYASLTLYNNTGRYTEFQELKADGTAFYKTLYSYNMKEKKGEVTYFDKDGKSTGKYDYIFDDKGRKIEEIQYKLTGEVNRRYTYTYDENGNNTSMTGYKSDGTMSSKTTWGYDAKGNNTDWKLETPGYATSTKKNVYDDKGNKIDEITYNGRGEIKFHVTKSYDAKGNVLEERTYKEANSFLHNSTWKYEYDKMGNWTKRTQTSGEGEDFNIEERTITYY